MLALMFHSAGYAAIVAILACALTRFSIGERADQYPAGAIKRVGATLTVV